MAERAEHKRLRREHREAIVLLEKAGNDPLYPTGQQGALIAKAIDSGKVGVFYITPEGTIVPAPTN